MTNTIIYHVKKTHYYLCMKSESLPRINFFYVITYYFHMSVFFFLIPNPLQYLIRDTF